MLCLRNTITKHKTCECAYNKKCHNTNKSQHCGDSPLLKRRKNTEKRRVDSFSSIENCAANASQCSTTANTRKQHRHQACFWFFTKLLSGAPPTQCKTQATITKTHKCGRLAVHYNEIVNACVQCFLEKKNKQHNFEISVKRKTIY